MKSETHIGLANNPDKTTEQDDWKYICKTCLSWMLKVGLQCSGGITFQGIVSA